MDTLAVMPNLTMLRVQGWQANVRRDDDPGHCHPHRRTRLGR